MQVRRYCVLGGLAILRSLGSCILRMMRSFRGRLLESLAVGRPLLCGLLGEVPIIVAGRAVDELPDDVGMSGMPGDFHRDMHHDLLQGDLVPLSRPPRNSAGRVERERFDGVVCMECCTLVERNDVLSRLLGR